MESDKVEIQCHERNYTRHDQKNKNSTFLAAVCVGGFCGESLDLFEPIGQLDRFNLSNKIENLVKFGATPLNSILYNTPKLFTSKHNKKTVILISDGMDSCKESFLLCSTANMLNSYNIELSVFSFLLEGDNFENNFAYEIYECMTEV